MDTATKTGIDAAKTTSKRVVQKTAEATGDLEIKQLIKLLQQQTKKNKRNRENLHTTRKKTTDY